MSLGDDVPAPYLQISEFPTGDFGSNRQAVSVETDRPFRSKAAPRCEWVLVPALANRRCVDTSCLALTCLRPKSGAGLLRFCTISGGFTGSGGCGGGSEGGGASGGEPVWDQRQHGDSPASIG
jgi:hypothetical protein